MALTVAQQIQLLQAAGVPVTTTKPTSGNWVEWAPGIYTVNPSDNPNDPRHGLTAQQYNLAAAIVNPNLNTAALTQELQQAGVPLAGTALVGSPTQVAPGTPTTGASGHHPVPGGVQPGPSSTLTGPIFAPSPAVAGTSGVADPNQPFGAGFGTDYGLDPSQDPNFAFGSGSTAPPPATQQPSPSPTPTSYPPGTILASPGGQLASSPVITQVGPDGQPVIYVQGNGFGAFKGTNTLPKGTTVPANVTQPTVIGTTGQASTGATAGSQGQQNALASIQQVLNTYGLGSLANWAWGEIVAGKSQDQIILDLYQTPEFKARFPAIASRQASGLPAISPADYLNYENQATQLFRAAGLPSGFWDSPSDFTNLIGADVSINELSQRLNLATQAAYQVPADVRATLQRDYGVGSGQLAAFFLDPNQAEPLIQRDFTAAQIGGAAYRTGYGSTKSEDEMLTDLGVTPGQAQSGFNQLTQQRQLFSSLPGENTTGIGRDEQLQATFGGNALDQEQIVRRSKQRQAVFEQGGATAAGFAQGA